MNPLVIDLYCGLGGWSEGFLAEGYTCIGFDIERHDYGFGGYPGQLVIQDVTTLHGKQFKKATVIVSSPPCQEFSYMAMPWSIAKEKQRKIEADSAEQKRLTAHFDACFRIQREASEAAGHHIPMIVENVRGAQKWVGRSRWHFGSFHLWGDVPALMPITLRAQKFNPDGTNHPLGSCFAIADSKNRGSKQTKPFPDRGWSQGCAIALGLESYNGVKCGGSAGDDWFAHHNRDEFEVRAGIKQKGSGPMWFDNGICRHGSKSNARKAASAMIAKIPFPLSRHIARIFKGAQSNSPATPQRLGSTL